MVPPRNININVIATGTTAAAAVVNLWEWYLVPGM